MAFDAVAGALVVERRWFDSRMPTVEIELANGDRLTVVPRDPSQARAVVAARVAGVPAAGAHQGR